MQKAKNMFARHARMRQFGTERNTAPLPAIHEKPSVRKMTLNRVAIIAIIGFWLTYVTFIIIRQFFDGPQSFQFVAQSIGYLAIVTLLNFSALIYLFSRQGALKRFSKHTRVPREELDRHFSKSQPSITVLVPSYNEEVQVIRKTLISAALQEYPKKRIVLLIDDNPNPSDSVVLERLEATRALADDITKFLKKPQTRFDRALKSFEKKHHKSNYISGSTIKALARQYGWAANWLKEAAAGETVSDHVDEFFVSNVYCELANDLSLTSKALETSVAEKAHLSKARVHQLYRRLSWIFGAEIDIFERKQYACLSHESNKAMNLNSYIGLMGGTYSLRTTPAGPVLVPIAKKKFKNDIIIPDSDFLLTLDADSILLRDYCLRLVYLLEQPGNERVAVTQTPYSSFRGAPTRIERIASATTDIQHILHQGLTYYKATFWVGANAIIRKCALEDIAETEWVGGFKIRRFIQDRTVIEDTESSIDLAKCGWSIVNYPERLSYSATPPDFGSLVIQRRRWANGGLLILPKLRALIRNRKRTNKPISKMEFFLRLNYMASIAWASVGLIFMLAYPYDERLLSPLLPMAALPYFLVMSSDLKYCRYKRSDIFRIYGLNLVLLAVNLAGVLKSIQQALTDKKIPFARTPKVKDRTASPAIYIIAPLLIIAFSIFICYKDSMAGNWGNAMFAGFNASVTLYAVVAFLGVGNILADLWRSLINWLFVDVKPKKVETAVNNRKNIDWRAVLYYGDDKKSVPLSMLAGYDAKDANEIKIAASSKGAK